MTDVRPERVPPAVASLEELFEQRLRQRNGSPDTHGPAFPPQVSPAAVPASPVAAGGQALGVLPVGYEVISDLRQQASSKIGQASAADGTMSPQDQRQLGLKIIRETVSEWATRYAATAVQPLTDAQEAQLRQAVFDELFRAGRLQPLLDNPNVENILINGDRVRVDFADRPSQQWDPIAPNDRELVRLINHIARMQGQGERALTPATPNLNMRLGDGSRLAASYLITPRPQIVIRRHRTRGQGLDDLMKWGTLDSTLAAFLRASVKARKNIVLVGSQGAGKTSLLRAMAREIPRTERVGTLESEYELYLHEDPDGPEVVAYEGRESNGERGPDGKPLGELTLSDLFPQLLRMSLRRIIVGEVRSKEVVPMLHAMNTGEGGSMCTLHAETAQLSSERLVTLCLEAGIGMTEALAYRLVAQAIDLVVYIRLVDETELLDASGRPGRKHRFVSHVMEITGIGENNRPSHQMIFAPREEGGTREPRAVPQQMPSPRYLADIERAGFARQELTRAWGSWTGRLETVMPL
ncbi:CpaF family protein [Actinacidiphila sp. ITFR-21]|uniref:CpaF family protein n=1 Tax=Actinacidiphila sp. ITFR-21 TaxID=3075199 RepID=UPI00288A4B37|nr:ATPase, T2SS/T4P/T4SS family [Streptomyces sp. ITFR-21]WNI20110.1 ATPase, T2SS/T4P/T4SS family [Streptomyces sp. ITFR-21]